MTTKPHNDWLTLAALKAETLRYKEGDYQVLPDRILQGALDDAQGLQTPLARPLRHSELKALEDSPLTQLRLAKLSAQRRIEQGVADVHTLPQWSAVTPGWQQAAWGELRVAGHQGAEQSTDLCSENGHWNLSFQRDAQQQWTVFLKLQDEALLEELETAGQIVEFAVLDGARSTLLLGSLDIYGELKGLWPYPDEPAVHLNRHRSSQGAWTVEPV